MSTTPQRFGLSASKIAMFEQCPRRLWLSVHRPQLGKQNDGANASFASGHEVDAIARSLLPYGIMIKAELDLSAALEATLALLRSDRDQPIFAAALQHDGVLVKIDILEPNGSGGWRLVKVKNSTKSKGHYLGDIATQLWVAKNAMIPITGVTIRYIDNSFVLESEGSYLGLFKDADIAEEMAKLVAQRGRMVATMRSSLSGAEPETIPGNQCHVPSGCAFIGHCHQGLPAEPKWPVTVLPHGGGKRWLDEGIDDLLSIDPAILTSMVHRRVYDATVTGEVYHDVDGARAAVSNWEYPRTWLDFETIGFAVPRWVGTRPYQQIPFQFSAHIESMNDHVDHCEFLSLDGADPRRPCADALVALIPPTGAVIGYNASFEKRCITDLAVAFPDLEDRLRAIAERIVDLLPVTRASWYHRDQRGSWSIKAVLPTIAANLDYSGLEVKDGGNAQEAYLEAISVSTGELRRQAIDAALRAYCGRDTEAMMVIASTLVGKKPATPSTAKSSKPA
jgi:hypothetical protein